MATLEMVDTFVRQLLLDEHGDDLELHDRGYVVPGDPPVRVGVVDGNHRTRRVLVTAVVLDDVAPDGSTSAVPDARLLDAVNDLNALTLYGRYFVADGAVHIEDTVLADVLDPASLANAIGFVRWAAETQGGPLRERVWPASPSLPGLDEALGPDDPRALDDRTRLDLGASAGETPPASVVVNAGGYL